MATPELTLYDSIKEEYIMNNQTLALLATKDSCAAQTLAKAMVNWWMASTEEEAYKQIEANPGEDLAGISNSVIAGLTSIADQLGIPAEDLIEEKDLSVLGALTAEQVVLALDSIHVQWIDDNLTARRWAEKYFKRQLGQFRKTSKLPFEEVSKDLLFIQQYLNEGGSTLTTQEIEEAFNAYCAADTDDMDLDFIREVAKTFKSEIISEMEAFAKKAKPEIAEEVRSFLSVHNNPIEIIEETLSII